MVKVDADNRLVGIKINTGDRPAAPEAPEKVDVPEKLEAVAEEQQTVLEKKEVPEIKLVQPPPEEMPAPG